MIIFSVTSASADPDSVMMIAKRRKSQQFIDFQNDLAGFKQSNKKKA